MCLLYIISSDIMVNKYPIYFKKLVIDYYNNNFNKCKISDMLQIFRISNGCLYNWIHLYRNNELDNSKTNNKRRSKITANIKCYIRTYVIKHVNFNYKLLIRKIYYKHKINICKSTLYNILKKIKITRKRINNRIIIKDKFKYKQDVKKFINKIKNINRSQIVSIDESHFDNQLTDIYGWGLRGSKIVRQMYLKKKHRYTLICAVNNKKVIYYKIINGSANAQIFKQFIEKLCDTLNTKSYFLVDNARIHHANIVKKYIESSEHELIFNAPYSPQFNPIESVFSKVKYLVRKMYNVNNILLIKNITTALKKIKTEDLSHFFKHSLYNII